MEYALIGREAEIEIFTDVRNDVESEAGGLESGCARVYLVSGVGGVGKSTLLRHLMNDVVPQTWAVAHVDGMVTQNPALEEFGLGRTPTVVQLLDSVQHAVIEAYQVHGDGRRAQDLFRPYRSSVDQLFTLRDRAISRMSATNGRGYDVTAQDSAVIDAVVAMSAGTLVTTATGSPEAGIAVGPLAGKVSSAVLSRPGFWSRLFRRRQREEYERYELFANPVRELSRLLGEGIQEVAQLRPLLLVLDAFEYVSEHSDALVESINRSGPRTVWAIGSRGAENHISEISANIPKRCLYGVHLSGFSISQIAAYLETRISIGALQRTELQLIESFTRGLPLSVGLVADALASGVPTDEICGQVSAQGHGRKTTVEFLADALLSRFDASRDKRDKVDLSQITTFATAGSDPTSNPDILAALWNIAAEDVEGSLRDLVVRHDFFQPETGRLHEDVAQAIQGRLRGPLSRSSVRPAQERAVAFLGRQLHASIERNPGLDNQL